MRLLELSCPWIQVLVFVILDHGPKRDIPGVVVDAPASAGQHVVLVQSGNETSVACGYLSPRG